MIRVKRALLPPLQAGLAWGADHSGALGPGGRGGLSILMYHGLTADLDPRAPWHQLAEPRFRQQMEWIRRHLTPLPLEEALDALYQGELPPRACALTFDDGYQSVADRAAPILADLGLEATLFVVTELLGTDRVPWPDELILALRATRRPTLDARALGLGELPLGPDPVHRATCQTLLETLKATPALQCQAHCEALYHQLDVQPPFDPAEFRLMSWDTARAISQPGPFTIAAHTTRHEILSRQTDADLRQAIAASQAAITTHLGHTPRVFAYPNGRHQDFDDRAVAALRALDIPYALSTTSGRASPSDDPHRLPRIAIGHATPFGAFRLGARGLWRL